MKPGRPVVERALRYPRGTLAVLVLGFPLACWLWIVAMARDMYGPMTGSSAWMMRATWDLPYVLLLWAMWAAMMAAMMLPSATPLILLAARGVGARHDTGGAAARLRGLVAGYATVWAVFSVGATALQAALARTNLLTPMMEPSTRTLPALLLVTAGLYQLTSLKQACLRSCRSPMSLLGAGSIQGFRGGWVMGSRHGLSCVGCCWALMLLLFAGGVMNLFVIVALSVWVAVEKLAPFGHASARVSGILVLAAAAWVYWR